VDRCSLSKKVQIVVKFNYLSIPFLKQNFKTSKLGLMGWIENWVVKGRKYVFVRFRAWFFSNFRGD
jgi:hypothetical protein